MAHSAPATRSDLPVRLGMAIWLTTLTLVLLLFVVGLPVYHRALMQPCVGDTCVRWRPAPALATGLNRDGLSLEFYAAYQIIFNVVTLTAACGMAAVMIWRRREPMALFAGFTLMTFFSSFNDSIAALGVSSQVVWGLLNLLAICGWSSLFVFFFVFPDGRFVPRWTSIAAAGWTLLVAVTYLTMHQATSGIRRTSASAPLFDRGISICLLLVIVAQVYRYRRVSGPIERQQTKWVLWGFAATIILLGTFIGLTPATVGDPQSSARFTLIGLPVFAGILLILPFSFAVAILRYGLWEIDVIINRTLVYGSLTLTLAALYIGGVVGLQSLFRAVTGQSSELAVAIVTLVIAALFNPWRRRVQRFVDRRFYRQKYNATHTLALLSTRIRDEVDLDQLAGDLVGVIHETVQPTSVSLWLRDVRGQP